MGFDITDEFLRELVANPHFLGHLMGKDRLLPLHSEWIKYVWDSPKGKPSALMAFRGGYKSTAIDVVGIVRNFLVRPNERIAIIRKNMTDATTIVDSVKQAMKMPEIVEVFKFAHGFKPKVLMSKENKVRYNFKQTVTPEASLTAFGLDSSLTGFHFDRILCDDIITLKDRISKAEREHTKEVVRELATNIIDPGKNIMFIGTPWHNDDAWTEINKYAEIAMYPLSKYNFLGEEAVEQKRRTTTPFLFAANYELELRKDESALFQDPAFTDTWKKSYVGAVAHVDAGFEGSDNCAMTIISPLDDRPYPEAGTFQCVGFSYTGHVKDWMPFIRSRYVEHKCTRIYIEKNADKGYVAQALRNMGMNVFAYHETENKDVKISTVLYEYWSRLRWHVSTDSDYMNMILDWRPSLSKDHDDAPDSVSSLLREVCKPNARRTKSLYEW